jgi:hypothetical protein
LGGETREIISIFLSREEAGEEWSAILALLAKPKSTRILPDSRVSKEFAIMLDGHVEVKAPDEDSGCFHKLASVRPLDAGAKESLRSLLTQEQYDALIDIVDRGGPNIDAIRRLRAASMI